MRAFLFSITVFWYLTAFGQSLSLDWVKVMGGENDVTSVDLVVDERNDIIITGYFKDTIDLNPLGTNPVHGSIGNTDVFVAKYDPTGNLKWSVSFGGKYGVYSRALEVDKEGNIYIVGEFSDTVDFDPDTSVFLLNQKIRPLGSQGWSGGKDFYILKLDSVGHFLSAIAIGGYLHDEVNDIAIDSNSNLYVTGSFTDTVDFNPASGKNLLISNYGTLTNVFVAKYDKQLQHVWSKGFIGSGAAHGKAIEIDKVGNVICTGNFTGTIDFDPGNSTFYISRNISNHGGFYGYLVKLNDLGNFVWGTSFEGDGRIEGIAIATDDSSNIYTTGTFERETNFYPKNSNFILRFDTVNSVDAFVTKFSSIGVIQWVAQIGTNGVVKNAENYDYVRQSQVKPKSIDYHDGRVFFSGTIGGMADFDPGNEENILYTAPACKFEAFVGILDVNGTFEAARKFGNDWRECIVGESANALKVLSTGEVLLTGYFQRNTDFDPSDNKHVLSSRGESDIFLLRFKECTRTVAKDTIDQTACFKMLAPSRYTFGISDPYNSRTFYSTWRKSGIYKDYVTNVNGCDHINYYNVTINEVDTSVSLTDTSITSNALNAKYKWLDCEKNFLPASMTDDSSKTFVSRYLGYYKAEVIQNGCTLNTNCYQIGYLDPLDIGEIRNTEVIVFPNPNNGQFLIQLGKAYPKVEVNLFNQLGTLIGSQSYHEVDEISQHFDVPRGVYHLIVSSGSELHYQQKIIIE